VQTSTSHSYWPHLLLLLAATTLGSSAHFGLGTLPYFRGRLSMPGTALYGPGVFVHQAEKFCDILDVMRGELFYHLLIPHILAKCDYNRSIRNMRNGVTNLREPLDEGAQRFPRTLSHGLEIGLITQSRVCTLEVGCELMAQLLPRGESALRQVHET
jgi:hypothetical protein